jgi:exosortase A-associated hydrolase 2
VPGAEPQFLQGPRGPLFSLYFPPAGGSASGRAVLHVPAFAEEMNKCRRMVALQARELAGQGLGVLLLDLYGTGDSHGDFADARWEIWRQDLATGVAWLRARGMQRLSLWGMRLGCLLAVDTLAELGGAVDHLLFWQPVASGQQMLTQFLRLRMAAGLLGGERESVAQLRARLAAGESLEVAGYELAPDLAAALDRVSLADGPAPLGLRVDWLEVVAAQDRGLGPASARLVQAWEAAGVRVQARPVAGDAFWSTQEIALAPELIRCTGEIFAAMGGVQPDLVPVNPQG